MSLREIAALLKVTSLSLAVDLAVVGRAEPAHLERVAVVLVVGVDSEGAADL